MLDELLKVQEEQRCIIRKQANIIDDMFVLLCSYVALEDLEPLLNNIKDVTDKQQS